MAFYVAGEGGAVLNALMLFDEYFAWKAKQMAKEIEVNIYTHADVELDEDKFIFLQRHCTTRGVLDTRLPLAVCN